MNGFTVKEKIGIGDKLQFSSLPENYFRHTGKKLVDVSKCWVFDHNPFVTRDTSGLEKVVELWNFAPTTYDWPDPRESWQPKVYLSNAEISAGVFGVPVTLNRPRLYIHENFPFHKREKILFLPSGKSHGEIPDYIVEHILKKYMPTKQLFQIGLSQRDFGIPKIETPDIWDLVKVISECRMLIAPDSGPTWIAACFPDVVVKKLRLRPSPDQFKNWVPLDQKNIHSFWDDRCHQIFNPTQDDIGFTYSYRKI